jgi:glycosyltransferase involved in cell wall biosynthesis
MIKFAIILPTIGRETLLEAIDSVLQQTHGEFILIVSYDRDDAFRRFSPLRTDKRILHISPCNEVSSNDSGANARNYAMQFVPPDCKWVCYIDDDDTWYASRLKGFSRFIEESDPELQLFYSYGDLYQFRFVHPRSSKKEIRRIGLVDNVTCGGMCHTIEAFKKTPGWNPNNLESHDHELYGQMSRHVKHDVMPVATFAFTWR